MSMSADHKRRFTRVSFNLKVNLTVGDRVITSNKSRDLSLGGMFVESNIVHPTGTVCEVQVHLTGETAGLYITAEAEVVRTEPDGMGLIFVRMDVDSLTLLKHLIAIQSGDLRLISREYFCELLAVEGAQQE
jgi:hypothetical protein